MPRRVISLLLGLIGAAVAVGCGGQAGGEAGQAPSAACPPMALWNGSLYVGGYSTASGSAADLRQGDRLEGGVAPACCDTPGSCDGGDKGAPLELWTIEGVDPSVALMGAGLVGDPSGERPYFIAAGTLPQLPSHPLHEAIFGSPDLPDERSESICSGVATVDAEVAETPTGSSVSVRPQFPAGVTLDANTQVAGFPPGELPRLNEGDRVRIELTHCALPEEPDRRFPVADRITLLPDG